MVFILYNIYCVLIIRFTRAEIFYFIFLLINYTTTGINVYLTISVFIRKIEVFFSEKMKNISFFLITAIN